MNTRLQNSFIKIITVCTGIWAALVMSFVVSEQLRFMRHMLFFNRNFLAVNGAVSQLLIKKLCLGGVVLVLGICCFFLDYLVVNTVFLNIARIFFYGAGIISTIWELDTLFFIGEEAGRIWNKNADVFVVFFVVELLFLLLRYLEKGKKLMGCMLLAEGAFFFLFLINIPQYKAIAVLKCFAVVMSVTGAVILIRLRMEHSDGFWTGLFMVCSIIYTTWLTGWNKIDFLSPFHTHYIKLLPYATAFFCIVLFLMEFGKYRRMIFYDRFTNRKLNEATLYKEEILKRVNDYYVQPLTNVVRMNDHLLKEGQGEESEKILTNIQDVLRGLIGSMNNLQLYDQVFSNSLPVEKIRTGYRLIFELAMKKVQDEGIRREIISYHTMPEERYVLGAPYQLLYVHRNFLEAFYELCDGRHIDITLQEKEKHIVTQMETRVTAAHYKQCQRIHKILGSKKSRVSAGQDEDMSFVIIRYIIRMHEGALVSSLEGDRYRVRYMIPVSREQPGNAGILKPSETEEKGDQIILITSLTEEVLLVKAYLVHCDYSLTVFYTEQDALEYIGRIQKIGVILIGTIFESMSIRQLCGKIRSRFSVSQVSVILLCKDSHYMHDSETLKMINDILFFPFHGDEFILKVNYALMHQKSIETLLKTQLDFLQSQIQPHFIFNSINAIMPMCIEQPEKAYRLLGSFGEYLRGNLFTDECQFSSTIYKEAEMTKAYLELEKARFGELVSYQINLFCEEEIKILPLLIEPIVENCVKHGFNGVDPIHIEVEIFQEDGWIYVQVSDDGTGISRECMDKIFEINRNSIGLVNIQKRLKAYYNEELEISSVEGRGTTVKFKISVKEEDHL